MQNSPLPQHQSNQPEKNTITLDAGSFSETSSFLPYKLSFVLQCSLNLYDVLKKFNNELKKTVKYQSLHYYNTATKHQFEIGQTHYHQAKYNLKLEDDVLGEITFSKNVSFSDEELNYLENALIQLLYPIKNSLEHEKALKLSITDTLTQLNNRQGFEECMKREVESAKRHGSKVSLLVIDIDHFKKINDEYGHLAGDAILRQFAYQLRRLHRQTDMIFRFGGEEFTIIMPHTEENGAKLVAQRICDKIEAHDFLFDQTVIPVTISIGISIHEKSENAKSLFSRADSALYAAKSNGRNQVRLA